MVDGSKNMLPIERQEKIKEYLVKNEFAHINELTELLGVSKATVRRSLKELENGNVVKLTHGGAALAREGNITEHPYTFKRHMYLDEKRRIARHAATYLGKNQSIFLDSSSTVFEMTGTLSRLSDILAATNDVHIAAELTNAEGVTVSVIGGTLRKGYYTLTGHFAESAIRDISLDCTFLGIDTISLERGLMITNSEEVQIKRSVIEASKEVIVLCDHSKFEKQSFLRVCGFDQADLIITGSELSDEIYQRYIDSEINLIRV